MYRAGEIKPAPIKTFDVANIGQAYRWFSSKDRVGKIVISLENQSSHVPVSSLFPRLAITIVRRTPVAYHPARDILLTTSIH